MPAAASQRSWTRTPNNQHQPILFLTLPTHASHAGTTTAFGLQHQSRRIASLKTSRSLLSRARYTTGTLISTKQHHGEPGAAYPCERSACFREFPRPCDYFYYARARSIRRLECEGFELGEVEALGGLAALVRDRLPLDSFEFPGQRKGPRRALRYTLQVRADGSSLDDLRGQHLQQTVLRHLPQHSLLHHPPHTDPGPQSPEPTGGTRKMESTVPRRTAAQILPGPASAGRIAVREICARVAVRRRPRRITTTLARRRRSGRIGRNRAR
jgi:hypothetical protein